jgi:thiol-disulfide isomerase/thioredoxin
MKKTIIAVAIASSVTIGGLVGLSTFASGESADSFRESVLRDPDVPSMGNPQGDITIVEYFDYQCPYCKKVAPELVKIAKEDGKLRIVMKDWPIFGVAKRANRSGPALEGGHRRRSGRQGHDDVPACHRGTVGPQQ